MWYNFGVFSFFAQCIKNTNLVKDALRFEGTNTGKVIGMSNQRKESGLQAFLRRAFATSRLELSLLLVIIILIIVLIIVSCHKKDTPGADPATNTPDRPASGAPLSPGASPSDTPSDTPTETPTPTVYVYGQCSSVTTDVSSAPLPGDNWEIDYLMLVNWESRLKYSGNPEGLCKLTDVLDTNEYIIEDKENGRLNRVALEALDKMCRDARAAGCSKVKISTTGGYRTFATQDGFWQSHISEDPNYGFDPYNNPPRTIPGNASEHRTGLGVDVWLIEYDYEWLHQNCYKYGFILRYPSNKTRITGIMYEQWHFRYVGLEAAAEIKDLGMCLEEYIAYKNGEPIPTPHPKLPTPTPTPTPTPEPTEVPTETPTPTVAPTETPTPTPTVVPTVAPTASPTPTPTPTPTPAEEVPTPTIDPDFNEADWGDVSAGAESD